VQSTLKRTPAESTQDLVLTLITSDDKDGFATRGWQNGNPKPDIGGLAGGLKVFSDLGLNTPRDLKKLQHSWTLHGFTVHP
jgi:hypothetical protein